jgi:3-oxoadipate enol-lactonase
MTERHATTLHSATVTDGTNIVYARSTANQPVVGRIALLHSLAMDHTFWNPVIAALPTNVDLIAIDARGHGRSDKPHGPYTVELFADDLAEVCAHAGWSSAVMAGASMGGSVTLAFAARHPQMVDGLALIDTTACYGDGAIIAWQERGQKALDGGMSALTEFQEQRWFSDAFRQASPELVSESVAVFLNNDPAPYMETCRMLGNCDTRAALPTFNFPVAIVVGEEDYATPVAMAEAMHAAIAGSTLDILAKVRHYTPVEAPKDIARAIETVLQRATT